MRSAHSSQWAALFLALFAAGSAWAVNSIQVGPLQLERPTLCCIGLVVPISGDDDYDAQATVAYRLTGSAQWREALPLLRVRPDTLGQESPPGDYGLPDPGAEFAGSIFGLPPDQSVEVRVSVSDPDGGSDVLSATARTRGEPRADPETPNRVAVNTSNALTSALGNAQAGDVIEVAAGTYSGPFTLSRSGTTTNPIVVRGTGVDTSIIDASGAGYGFTVSGSHVHVESLTIRGSDWGMRLSGAEDVVVRRLKISNVNKGMDGRNGSHRDFVICDNTLEGRIQWPNISSSTWDQEGIVITGEGHVVCHNALSGFGDALGLSQNTSIPNRAIDFYRNDVLWSGDDGLEIDYGHRNVRVFENRVTNSGMGISIQPSWGGPIYIVRNVLVNQAAAPYKFNNDPTGILVLNNTSIRSSGPGNYGGAAWPQLGYSQSNGDWSYVANFQFLNNIVIGTTAPAKFTSAIRLGTIDSNAWYPDGTFVLYDTYSNLADVQARSAFEQRGIIASMPTFASPTSLGADYTTRIAPADVSLHSGSNAIDAALALPNVTDGFQGAAPDLGAWEAGASPPSYGPRRSGSVPLPPTNVSVE